MIRSGILPIETSMPLFEHDILRSTTITELTALVRAYFLEHGSAFGLDPQSLDVDYVLNAGGFVNHSFRVTDDHNCYHLKLATNTHSREGLLRWQRLSSLLEGYRAPPVRQWIDIGSAGGLLFRCVAGSPPELDASVLRATVQLMRDLNNDNGLAAVLRAGLYRTAQDVYHETYHARFTEDLLSIRDAKPPFVTPASLEWMRNEVNSMAQLISNTDAFHAIADRPVHGDLWLHNILWESADDWHIVDWDDVGLGDPMMDLASLTGPSADDLAPLKLLDEVSEPLSANERARLLIYGRASLLDWIIDPLADWVEAEVAPEYLAEVRLEKERVHRSALALYHELYD
jgi:hypothetical protein